MRGEKNLCVSQFHSFGENTLKYIRSKYVKSLATSVSTSGIKLERIEITHCVELSTQKGTIPSSLHNFKKLFTQNSKIQLVLYQQIIHITWCELISFKFSKLALEIPLLSGSFVQMTKYQQIKTKMVMLFFIICYITQHKHITEVCHFFGFECLLLFKPTILTVKQFYNIKTLFLWAVEICRNGRGSHSPNTNMTVLSYLLLIIHNS